MRNPRGFRGVVEVHRERSASFVPHVTGTWASGGGVLATITIALESGSMTAAASSWEGIRQLSLQLYPLALAERALWLAELEAETS
jgi:hypothetical protein